MDLDKSSKKYSILDRIKAGISPYDVQKYTISPTRELPNFDGYTYIKYYLSSEKMETFDRKEVTISDWYRCTRETPNSDTWRVQHFKSEPWFSYGNLMGAQSHKSVHYQSTAELRSHIIKICQKRELQITLSKKRIEE